MTRGIKKDNNFNICVGFVMNESQLVPEENRNQTEKLQFMSLSNAVHTVDYTFALTFLIFLICAIIERRKTRRILETAEQGNNIQQISTPYQQIKTDLPALRYDNLPICQSDMEPFYISG